MTRDRDQLVRILGNMTPFQQADVIDRANRFRKKIQHNKVQIFMCSGTTYHLNFCDQQCEVKNVRLPKHLVDKSAEIKP